MTEEKLEDERLEEERLKAVDSAIPSRSSKKKNKEKNKEKNNKEKKQKSAVLEMVEIVVVALALAFFIKTFVAGNYWIPSESMVPTIEVNDKVIVTNFSYWVGEPERGDVIVFKYPNDTKKDYIKRCIGLPGETIEFKNSLLYVNGQLVDEPYLPEGLEFEDYGPVVVPEDSYFMCGDNRNHSADSRDWGFLPDDLIIGKAQVIYWPFSRWSAL